MMFFYDDELYLEDILNVSELDLPWEKLLGKKMLISGATGLIGSFLVDVIMKKNIKEKLQCDIYLLTRNTEKAKLRFSKYNNCSMIKYVEADVRYPIKNIEIDRMDYVLHLASNTHPMQYSTDPIGTITTNIIGLQNMLEFAIEHETERFLFASSNEIYGENRGDTEFFDEEYCGYINSNTMRAGYPESKRCGESLCQAYRVQKKLDVVIARLTRTYGPTMLMTDTKAISQFIKKCIAGEDIILKSAGNQYYSYQYMSDSVSGLLTVMLCGAEGEAYNIADEKSDVKLKDLANIISSESGQKVIYEIPNKIEAAGYSTATKARLNGNKLKKLGWSSKYNIREGVKRTISILKNM